MDSVKAVESITQTMSDYANKVLQGKKTVYEARGIDQQAMDSLYMVAQRFYDNGKFEDAMRIFRQLCFYNHNNVHYWLGLGYSQKMLRDYRDAMTTLSFVLAYLEGGDKNAEVYLHLAECCSFLGRDDEAEEYAIAAMNRGDQSIKDHASVLIEAVNSRQIT